MPIPDDPDALATLVRSDVETMFQQSFPPFLNNDGFDLPESLNDQRPIVADGVAVLPWRWRGRHDRPFLEARPTGNQVEIVGVTIIREEGGSLVYHRIVDWLTLYRQIGFMMVCRRPRSPDTEDFDRIDIPAATH